MKWWCLISILEIWKLRTKKKSPLLFWDIRVPKATISSQLGDLLSSTDLHALQIAPDQVVLHGKGSMYFPDGLSDPTYS